MSKHKIWIDENGVVKWHFANWPKLIYGEELNRKVLEQAKSEAVEFEDQQAALKLCWENDREIHNPLSFGHWQVELKRFMVDRFYDIELDGRIEIQRKAGGWDERVAVIILAPQPEVAVESEEDMWRNVIDLFEKGYYQMPNAEKFFNSEFQIRRRR